MILITHRAGLLSVCDKLLVLRDGAQQAFGACHEILRSAAPAKAVAGTNARLKVVGAATAEAVT